MALAMVNLSSEGEAAPESRPLAVSDLAPDFALERDDGDAFRLAEHAGRRVVLFFYAQANTEGCTDEAVEFSGIAGEFHAEGAVVAGISPDRPETLQSFRQRYGLTTLLLADPDHLAIGPFRLWRPKTTFGRAYVGLVRTTFLIGPDRHIEAIWPVARIKGHAAKVLAHLRAHPL